MNKLYLIDVSSMFFRAYYAIRHLTNENGLSTNAVYGLTSMIIKLLKEEKPSHIAFCYDLPTPSFRKEIYPDYKANRGSMPEDLGEQIPYIKKLIDCMGFYSIHKDGFEADDLIGTLAKRAVDEASMEVVIVSGDKDFAQLINEKVTMLDTMKAKIFNPEEVFTKWGVKPEKFIDYLAITGDSSDNIPGVKGIGPKGAVKLLDQFESLEEIYKGLDLIKNKNLVKKLEDSTAMAKLSKELVTIRTDVELPCSIEDLTLGEIKKEELGGLFDELGFESFKKQILVDGIDEPTDDKKNSKSTKASTVKAKETTKEVEVEFKPLLYTKRTLSTFLKKIDELIVFKYDEMWLMSDGQFVVHFQGSNAELKELFEKYKPSYSGFDVKSFITYYGLDPVAPKWDLQLAAYVDLGQAVKELGQLAKIYKISAAAKIQPDKWVALYKEISEVVQSNLDTNRMDAIYKNMEVPISEILCRMERNGAKIDVNFMNHQSSDLAQKVKDLEQKIHELAGEEFKVSSPKQLSEILFTKLELKPGKKTKTGYSTDNSVLEKLKGDHDLIPLVLKFREFSKLNSTYFESFPKLVNEETGRIHTVYNQALTTTGRLSSSQPNLQNIPIKTAEGLKVREAFVPSSGNVLVAADYSQIELRILAEISKDLALKDAFQNDEDVHQRAACEIFNVKPADVTADLRRKAKAVNFGIAYGQGVFGLAETLSIPRSESKEIITRYFDRFTGVKSYMEEMAEKVKEQGYVETLLGRRRYLPDIESKKAAVRAFAERAAINAPIQGTASDIVKLAMISLAKDYSKNMLIQVHDEIVFEFEESDRIDEIMRDLKNKMENCISLSVPLKVNIECGENWAQLK